MYWNYPNFKERIYNSDFLEYCRKSSTLENKAVQARIFLSAAAEKAAAQQKKCTLYGSVFF
jgi:hypothetical protein